MKQGWGTCSTFKAFNLTYLHVLCAGMVYINKRVFNYCQTIVLSLSRGQLSGSPSVQALHLSGTPALHLVLDPLAVIFLDNCLYMLCQPFTHIPKYFLALHNFRPSFNSPFRNQFSQKSTNSQYALQICLGCIIHLLYL